MSHNSDIFLSANRLENVRTSSLLHHYVRSGLEEIKHYLDYNHVTTQSNYP